MLFYLARLHGISNVKLREGGGAA